MPMCEFCRGCIVAYNLTDDESTIKFELIGKCETRPIPY